MRISAAVFALFSAFLAMADELESRVLTHYVPQDFLEIMVRTENWTEIPLNLKGGIRKGDVVRIWAGGCIDRGDSDQPGINVCYPSGPAEAVSPVDSGQMALAKETTFSFAILW